MAKLPWKNKISNPAQIGGIETSILDNGPGKGVRIAWINTGTGLRYKVLIDRAMDIGEAFYNEHCLSWISHHGVSAPRPDATNTPMEWLYTFHGGLVTTCGLQNAGAPTDDYGLHGRIANIPAEIESIIQPDPANGKLDFSITGTMKESKVFGPCLELRRTLSGKIGNPEINITDTVTNRANIRSEHIILYHCNFGYPILDEGAEIIYDGKLVSRSVLDTDDERFNSNVDYKKVPAPMKSHKSTGEACAFIDPKADRKGICTTGIYNKKLGFAAMMEFNKSQLPYMTTWHHFGPSEYVLGLEPGSYTSMGAEVAKKDNAMVKLSPGKSAVYELKISIETDKGKIKKML